MNDLLSVSQNLKFVNKFVVDESEHLSNLFHHFPLQVVLHSLHFPVSCQNVADEVGEHREGRRQVGASDSFQLLQVLKEDGVHGQGDFVDVCDHHSFESLSQDSKDELLNFCELTCNIFIRLLNDLEFNINTSLDVLSGLDNITKV